MATKDLMIFLKCIREINKSVRKAWNFSISGPQLHLLNLLEINGELRMSDLSDELGISQSGATSLANRMIKENYVTRVRSNEDRRVVTLKITDDGREFLEHFSKSRDVAIEKFFGKLSADDKAEMARLCRKMLE
jgi:DNA-binding MarR family transcriptional regulator